MNRGFYGKSRGKGQQPGLQHTFLGSTTPGYNTETLGAGAYKHYAKKITPPKSGILASVDVLCQAGSSVQALYAGVANNDGGVGGYQFPGRLISARATETSASVPIVTANLGSTPRWLSIHCGTWLEAGQTYWMILRAGNTFTIYYTDDTGPDCEYAQNGSWFIDFGASWSVSNKRWSIRGSFVY